MTSSYKQEEDAFRKKKTIHNNVKPLEPVNTIERPIY